MVTHLGQSPNCGHYTAIAEGSNGSYYQFDDQFVHEVTGQTALNNDAYLLIYEMDRNSQPTGGLHYSIPNSPNILSKPAAATTSGTLITNGNSDTPKKFAIPFAKKNGIPNSPALNKPTVLSNTDSSKANGNSGPDSSGDRRVIRFGIPPNSLIKSTAQNKINVLQPGIAVTNSARVYSSSLSTMVVPKANCVPLVPYGDIDNDEATEQEPKEETRKTSPKQERIIGPLLEVNNKNHHQRSPSPAARVVIPYKLPSSPPLSPKANNPEYKFGIKRKSEAMLGSTSDLTKSDMPTSKKSPINATSKWTIVSLKNGNLSDPEKNSSESSKIKSKELIRAKSAERTTQKSQQTSRLALPPPPPLIPNAKRKLNDSTKINLSIDSTTKSNGSSFPSQSTPKELSLQTAVQNGHHEKKKKRKRSRSSSSSSDSSSTDRDRNKQKKEGNGKLDKKKKLKKKGRETPSKRSSSSDDSSDSESDSSSGGRRHGHKRRHKNKKRRHSKHRDESKEKIKVSSGKGEMNGWLPTTERDASSVEREQILRQARNPSRSPSKSISSKSSDRFNPSRIEGREKSSKFQFQYCSY